MKKWLKVLFVSFFMLVATVWIILRVNQENIRIAIENEIDQRLEASVTFSQMGLSFWRHFPNLTLSLEDLSVVGKEEFAQDTLLFVPKLHLELSTGSFFSGEIKLLSIQFVQPNIFAHVLANGKANYSIMKSDSLSSSNDGNDSNFKLEIDEMLVENGNIVYLDAVTRTRLVVTGLDHKGKGDFSLDVFDYETSTTMKELSLTYDDVLYLDKKNLSIDLAMGVNTKTLTFKVLRNSARINHFKFALEGYTTLLTDGLLMDLKFSSQETELKNILSLLPGMLMEDMEHITTGGEASFQGFAKGHYAPEHDSIPAFHLDLKVKDGNFKIDSLPASLNNIQFDLVLENDDFVLDSTIFDLRNFHFDIGDQPVHGRVKIKGVTNYFIEADVLARLNLQEIETIYSIPGIDMKGYLNFELKAKGNYVPSEQQNKPSQIPKFSFTANLSGGHLHYDSLPASIDDINMHMVGSNGTGKFENTSLSISHLSMRLDDNYVKGKALIKGLKSPSIESEFVADLDLADLNRIFPMQGFDMKGALSVDMKMNGVYDSALRLFPKVDANITLLKGFLKAADYPEPIEQVNLSAELINNTGKLKDSRFNIHNFSYTLEGEPFSVSGLISDFQKFNFDIDVKGKINLEKLTNVYPVKGWELKGIITSDIETTGMLEDVEKGNYEKLHSKGTVEVSDFYMSGNDLPRPIAIHDALFRLTPQKILLQQLSGKVGKSNVNMKGELSNYMSFATSNEDLIKGDIILKCDTLFVDEWIPQSDTNKTKSPSDKLAVFAIPVNVDFVFDSNIGYVKYDDIKVTKLDGEIKLKDGIMTLHETGFNSLDAKFNVTGDYDTRDMKRPIFDFHIDIKELDIQRSYKEIKLIRTLAPATADCAGTFSISYDLNGELNADFFPKTETLKGSGRIRIANAKIDGMKIFEELSKAAKKSEVNDPHLKDFVMDTEIRDNKIFVKPFSIKVSGFNTEIEGVNDLSGAIQYLVKIELLPIEKIKIPFHITGTYDNPKVSLGKGATLPE